MLFFAASCMCQSVLATVTVSPMTGVIRTNNGGKWQITINRTNLLAIENYFIRGDANDNIEYIRVTLTDTRNPVLVGAEVQLIIEPVLGTSGIGSVEEVLGVFPPATNGVWIGKMDINGNCGGASPTSQVKVTRLELTTIGGNLLCPINLFAHPSNFVQPTLLRVFGDVHNHIFNDNATSAIGSIVVDGDIKSLGSEPIVIRANTTIQSLIVGGSIIDANIGQGNSPAYMDRITLLEVAGDFTKTITTEPVGLFANSIGTLRIGGNVGCTLRVEGGLPNDPNQPSIQIGGSLLDAGEIVLPVNGLKSQIIVNSNASSGAWTGDVIVGGVVLSPLTTYDNLPSTIGGGAAGRVQFTVHKKASVPDFSGTGPFTVGENGPIVLVHYGPVIDPMTGNTPYVITRTPVSGGAPVDCSLCFDQLRDPVNHTIMTLTPKSGEKMLRGYKYSVAPRSGVLRCDLPSGTGTAVAAYGPFAYAVCPEAGDALGDADDSGLVDFADITEVLADFGLPVVCSSLGDADRSGTIDFADVTSVLTNWLAAYCLTLGSSSGGQAGDGFTTMELDGELSAAEAIGNIADALAQMGYASPEAFSDAISRMTTDDRNAEVRRLGSLLQGSN
jgi:hypothetical protein